MSLVFSISNSYTAFLHVCYDLFRRIIVYFILEYSYIFGISSN
jgi:hypothetical protein